MRSPDTMTLIEKTAFLSTVEGLAGVPSEALAQLAARAVEIECERGRTVFHEGDEDRGTFIVVEGAVELRKATWVVRRLVVGQTHGELFLGENEAHQYTAVAVEDSHLLNLARIDVRDALLEHAEFGLAMVQDLSLRLHKLTERIIQLEGDARRDGAHSPAIGDGQPIEPAGAEGDAPRQRRWWRRRTARA